MSHVSHSPASQTGLDFGGEMPSLSRAWPPFAEALAQTLAGLKEDQYLILSVKHSNYFVQFAAQGAHGLRLETTSNTYLEPKERLSKQQVAALLELGWHAPTGGKKSATPERDPDGSPNYFVDMPPPIAFADAAEITVRTLTEIFNVPHPGYLEYAAFDDEGGTLALPGLGLKLAQQAPSPEELWTQLKNTLCEILHCHDLKVDADGDVAIRYGSIAAFVRLKTDPPTVRIYSPIVRHVESSPDLLGCLNAIHEDESFVRFVHHNDAIWCITEISASPYVAEYVASAFIHFCQVADDVDGLLKEQFGGETAFADEMPNVTMH